MSAAAARAVPPPPTPEPVDDYARMVTLWRYFQTAGACLQCALGIAIVYVEREAGNHAARASQDPCVRGRGDKCFALARAAAPAVPPRQQQQPPAAAGGKR